MSLSSPSLQQLAHDFRKQRGRSASASVIASADEALERLLAWAAAHSHVLSPKGPGAKGQDRVLGVTRADGGAMVWRIYPRQKHGGKVTLLPQAEHLLTAAERERCVDVLEALDAELTIDEGQRLEIGLSLLSGDYSWSRFETILSTALVASKRQNTAARSA